MARQDDDSTDVARVLAGDVEAFESIVQRWQHRLISLAWRFSRDRAMAEDMAQDVFVKLFRSLHSFRGDASFSTWITAIAVNTYRTRLRAQGPPLIPLDPTRISGHAPAESLDERERAESVRRAVLALPERYRDAILVYYFEEKDLSEAARILKVAEGTLKARLHRGRELLRRKCVALDPAAAGAPAEEA